MTTQSPEIAKLSAEWKRANLIAGVAEQAARDAVANRRIDRAGAMAMVRKYKVAHAAYRAAHARFFAAMRANRLMQEAA